jgi:hypothetical protein
LREFDALYIDERPRTLYRLSWCLDVATTFHRRAPYISNGAPAYARVSR